MDAIPADLLTDALTDTFPDRPGWTIADRQPVHSYQQYLERITLTWAAGDTEEVYLRVYHGYLSWWNLIALDLPMREYVAARIAADAGIPIAPVLYLRHEPDVMILGRMPGEAGRIPETARAVEHAAELLARLHAAPVSADDRKHLPDISLTALLPRLASWAEEAESDELRGEADELRERCAREVAEQPGCLAHGDFHPGNFLTGTDGNISAILDWEEAAVGDPRIDAAHVYRALRYRLKSEELAAHFVAAYEAHAGFSLGDLAIWREITSLRSRIVSEWVKHAIATGRPLPSRNPKVWIED